MPENPNYLPLRDRAKYYRAMAEEAMRSAAGAQSPLARADFVKVAEAWQALATQIDVALGFRIEMDEADPRRHRTPAQRH